MSFDENKSSAALNNTFPHIDAEKFSFVEPEAFSDGPGAETASCGYLRDVFNRFVKKRGSVICFFIILVLYLYAFLGPLFSPYKITDKDSYYAFTTPKNSLFEKFNWWDGCKKMEVNLKTFQYYQNIPGAIKKCYGTKQHIVANRPQTWYVIRLDTYAKVGWVKMRLTKEDYEAAKKWETPEHQLFYPVIDQKLVKNTGYRNDMNAWFATDEKGVAVKKAGSDKVQHIYLKDGSAPGGFAYCTMRMNDSMYEVRVLYREWYYYKHGSYPGFLFGTDESGYDIFTRLAHGARLSLILSIVVSMINLLLGITIGALEGYYGGMFDLCFERIKDIIYQVPTQVTMTLFQLYLAKKLGPVAALFFAFIFYGWIGMSSTVRAQFYRFKGQDYVSASRTLGARDSRLIFRHILPNAIGFIITVSVLTIPGVIFSEANLTYLGIVDLDSSTMTSVGTMLNSAKDTLSSYPHAVFFPAAFISILLVCFNEFGNQLRDAFNPSLGGTENE